MIAATWSIARPDRRVWPPQTFGPTVWVVGGEIDAVIGSIGPTGKIGVDLREPLDVRRVVLVCEREPLRLQHAADEKWVVAAVAQLHREVVERWAGAHGGALEPEGEEDENGK